ncbi:solute carrier organic anion transporter family member 74D-like [Oppia nitens]|uniref:solute carrier organic anion transporter family member 74D-like n=1 Tax=Oppia nitens TaxID=1686743 RepID=UPI0023DB6866|nr:solute carrier organic anion transporter family member 74D-like [Oppia nitens]
MGSFQGPYSYMISSLTTLERRYAIGSVLMGLVLIGDDISVLIFEPFIGYIAHRLHRPRMLFLGQVLSGIGCYVAASLYLIYGPPDHQSNNILTTNNTNKSAVDFCEVNPLADQIDDCQASNVLPSTTQHNVVIPVLFLFVSTFLSRLGTSAYYIIGLPFIDDIVKKKNSPFVLSLSMCNRIIGPAFASLLSSVVLRYYENPFVDPGITDLRDPRWVGAWWLGQLILGTCLILSGLPMLFFPPDFQKSSKNQNSRNNRQLVKPKHIDLSLKERLLKIFTNPIFMCYIFGTIFQMFGWMGYWTFSSKYVESQYRTSASTANLLSGMISLLPIAAGILLGGAFISVVKPGPRLLTSFVFIVELLSTMGLFSGLALGCPRLDFANLPDNQFNNFNQACDANCTCSPDKFQPLCDPNSNTNYLSPCLAGCPIQTPMKFNDTIIKYIDCECVSGVANDGLCDIDCGNNFRTQIIISSIGGLIGQLARVGNVFISLRVIDETDKHFAIGIYGALFSLFTSIPGPLIYGAIINSTCLIWKTKCGKTGNCMVYDTDKFRKRLFGVTLAFIILGSLFDVAVVLMSSRIKHLYDESDETHHNSDNDNNIIKNA